MKFVSRAGWHAREPTSVTALPRPTELVYHYSAADADEQSDHANCAKRVRGIQNFHMDTRKWNDIAYSFLVCKHGYVFEGRGWRHRTAATGHANGYTLACCFLGDDTKGLDDVTAAGREALLQVATAAFATKGTKKFSGHRDHMSTQCPGDEIHRYVTSAAFKRAATASSPPAHAMYDVRVFDNAGKLVKRWPRSVEPAVQLSRWNIAQNRPRRVTIDRVDK